MSLTIKRTLRKPRPITTTPLTLGGTSLME